MIEAEGRGQEVQGAGEAEGAADEKGEGAEGAID